MRFSLMKLLITLIFLMSFSSVGALEPANTQAALQTVTLDVQKMDCPMCKITIGRALKKVEGVTEAKVDYDSKTATVTFDPNQATVETLTQATTNVGYPSSLRK